MPCADIHAAESFQPVKNQIASDHDSCPHEKETDFCSPFCICSCCGQTNLIMQDRIHIHKLHIVCSKDSVAINIEAHLSSEYLDRLFHPPKI